MSQGIQAETEEIVTLLVIQNLSYEDAANYTCVVSPKPPLLLGAQQSFVTQQLSLPGQSFLKLKPGTCNY